MTVPPRDNSEPNSERGNETALLRRELDRQFGIRLQRTEEQIDKLDEQVAAAILDFERRMMVEFNSNRIHVGDLSHNVQQMMDRQNRSAPALDKVVKMVQSWMVMRWLIMGIVGIVAALATVATAWEVIRKWFG
jgi:hypothetical protein